MMPTWKKQQLEKLLPGKYCFYCLARNPRKIINASQIVYNCTHCGKTDGLVLKIDPVSLKSSWHHDELQHFTMGVILHNKTSGKFLLMKKRTYPQVIDVIAGHLRADETPTETLLREVNEETGLAPEDYKLIWHGLVENNYCRRGAPHHYWYLYLANYKGSPIPDLQEVGYFREYTWEELLNEKMLNPSISNVLAGLNTSLLEL